MVMRVFVLGFGLFFVQGAWAQPFVPFQGGEAHPFVGHADHIPGQGPLSALPKALNSPKPLKIKAAGHKAKRLSSNPIYLAALFYRHFLTKVDGPRCGHYPTCSHFANQAVGRHGVWGLLMGLERLIRTGRSSSVRWLPEIGSGKNRRFFDPIDNYVIWKPENFTGFEPERKEEMIHLIPLIG